MTDEKIIDALVDMASGENLKCAFRYCNVAHEILDLINRQKAEIERLKKNIMLMPEVEMFINEVEFKAYKKFAERFEKKIKDVQFTLGLQCALKTVTKELTEKDTSVSLVDGHIED